MKINTLEYNKTKSKKEEYKGILPFCPDANRKLHTPIKSMEVTIAIKAKLIVFNLLKNKIDKSVKQPKIKDKEQTNTKIT